MDLLIRGGEIVDGTGAAPHRADVRIRDGRMVEIAPELSPLDEQTIDAGGAFVAPGLIETHTHYDAAVWWDPDCDPMPAHGCTTLVMANCGLGLAPMRAADRPELVDLFAFIEDIPNEAFHEAVPWRWESWPEYHQAAGRLPTAVNTAAFFPHQMVRTWIMGADAWERVATADERERMCAALDTALGAGALGLSTSMMDTDRDNRLAPSRLADDAELADLIAVLARHDAVLQYVPRFLQPEHFLADLERVQVLVSAADVAMLFAGYRLEEANGDHRRGLTRWLESHQTSGARLWPNFSVRPSHVNMHFERSIMWSGVKAWHRVVNASPNEKLALLADPQWRGQARHDWDHRTYTLAPIGHPERLLLIGSDHSGESLREAFERTSSHPSDALADWLIATNVEGNVRTVHQPVDEAAAVAAMRSPLGLSGASDAGAHVQMFSGAGDSTYVLSHLVGERGVLRIEEAVQALTSKPARFFGIAERGVVMPGAIADLVVFDPSELDPGDEVRRFDLPGGSWRYSRSAGGYRATIVGGTPTWLDGEATGLRPGGMLSRTPTTGPENAKGRRR